MKGKLVIINHIGTSVLEAVEQELVPLVEEAKAFAGADAQLAFSSMRAIAKLREKGVAVPHVAEVLREAAGTYEEVIVLPTHLVGGEDFRKLAQAAKAAAASGPAIALVKPLLSNPGAAEDLAAAIRTIIGSDEAPVLFAGHGTSHVSGKHYEAFLQRYSRDNAAAAFIDLKDAAGQAAERLPEKMHLFPLFAVSGYHVQADLCGGEGSIAGRLAAAGKEPKVHCRGLLAYPEVRGIFLAGLDDSKGRQVHYGNSRHRHQL